MEAPASGQESVKLPTPDEYSIDVADFAGFYTITTPDGTVLGPYTSRGNARRGVMSDIARLKRMHTL